MMMRKVLVLGVGACMVVATSTRSLEAAPAGGAIGADGEAVPLFPGWPTAIADFSRVTPPPHFANYFEGNITYAVKIWAADPLITTLTVERKTYAGGSFSAFKTLSVIASAGSYVTVNWTTTPYHPCWGEEYRLTLNNTSAPVRIGKTSSDCDYDSVVTDSWSNLTPIQQAFRGLGKVTVTEATMTPAEPACGARLQFSARVANGTSQTITGVYLRWSKSMVNDQNVSIAPNTAKVFTWQEPAGDWFDDGSNFDPRELTFEVAPSSAPVSDRVWTKELKQSCILSVGLQ